MEIDLIKKGPLGIYPVSESGILRHEYQFGSTLIFVEYPEGNLPLAYIERAQCQIVAAWNDMRNAEIFAETLLKNTIPAGWNIFYKKQHPEKEYREGHWLLVYSIQFCADLSAPVYFISIKPHVERDLILFHEEDYWRDYPREFDFQFEPFQPNIELQRVSENTFEVLQKASSV
jgi:hypothetical protein